MAAAAWLAEAWLRDLLPGATVVLQAFRVGSAITIALVVLSAAAWGLGLHEFEEARRMVTGRLRRQRR
jgi:hypothetical protein